MSGQQIAGFAWAIGLICGISCVVLGAAGEPRTLTLRLIVCGLIGGVGINLAMALAR